MMFTLVLLATLLPWTFAFPNQQFVSHVVEEVRRFSGNEKPNILFVIDESTDAKAYFVENEEDAPMDLPNLRRLMREGTSFMQHYVQAPVCCPSRASTWSGRQVNPDTGLFVKGAYNNHEGLPANYSNTFAEVLKRNGYNVGIFGKTDYEAGGHSLDARVTAWTNKVNFPYSLSNGSVGFYTEGGPVYSTVHGSMAGRVTHEEDWAVAAETSQFIWNNSRSDTPWLVLLGIYCLQTLFFHFDFDSTTVTTSAISAYAGFVIVHPDYISSEYWLDRINTSKITIPTWNSLNEMHPEDFGSTMRKHMAGSDCCNDTIRVSANTSLHLKLLTYTNMLVRQHYYAMIAEYDAIIGDILHTVENTGQWNNTYMIFTADHGDMNMEHRQYYKMVHFDPSSRVPLIIRGPGIPAGRIYSNLTSQVDLYPTILDMASVPYPKDAGLDGRSLMPILLNGSDPGRQNIALSQFHGTDIHLSWFMLRKDDWKYVVYGSGHEVPSRLYNMRTDPLEMNDLASQLPLVVDALDLELRMHLDYPAIAEDAERYNK
eukprot:gene3495-6122_t